MCPLDEENHILFSTLLLPASLLRRRRYAVLVVEVPHRHFHRAVTLHHIFDPPEVDGAGWGAVLPLLDEPEAPFRARSGEARPFRCKNRFAPPLGRMVPGRGASGP